jgi:aminopeptidase N
MRRYSFLLSISLAIMFFSAHALAAKENAPMQAPLSKQTQKSGAALSKLQAAYDVLNYTLDLEILPKEKAIKGTGRTALKVVAPMDTLELDLDSRFDVLGITLDGKAAKFRREDGKLFIILGHTAPKGTRLTAQVTYAGKPFIGKNVPWDGGFVWSKTADGSPWIASAVQGEGCDMWFPCKDHYSDKPDTTDLRFTVPAGVSVASNGVLVGVKTLGDGRQTFHWQLLNPITPYNITLNVGPFVRIKRTYHGINGTDIPLEFWALKENEDKASALVNHDVVKQLAFFEQNLGPYPWGDSKIGFVETPHLGMEHQTINAYGNQYKRDDHGYDWLLQHELSHEWFGNVMTHKRPADAWLHEGTGLYMQAAYAKSLMGNAAYTHIMYKSYLGLNNCKPVVGTDQTDMAAAFHSDIYGKGAWVLHTLRGQIGEEAFWRSLRRLIYDTPEPWGLPYPITPLYRSTDDFIAIVNDEAGQDLGWFFNAYLNFAALPELEQTRDDKGLMLHWKTGAKTPFLLAVPVSIDGKMQTIKMDHGEGFLPVRETAKILIDPDMRLLRALPIIGTCAEQKAVREARRAKRKKQNTADYGWDKNNKKKKN